MKKYFTTIKKSIIMNIVVKKIKEEDTLPMQTTSSFKNKYNIYYNRKIDIVNSFEEVVYVLETLLLFLLY